MVKTGLLSPFFLRYIKMDNITHIERLRFAKTGGQRTLFHDLI